MMSKDWPRAVLAVLVVLPFFVGAGSASAADGPARTQIGAGIDFTKRTQPPGDHAGVAAADAIDRLNHSVVRDVPERPAPQTRVPSLVGGLRGLAAPALDGVVATRPDSSREWTSKPDWPGRARPYVRFNEQEQVFGFSFKIQPPPQVPEPAGSGL